MITFNQVINGDCLEVLKTLPDEIIDCCVTSPPYYGLRDYGVDGQIGLEETPEEYIEKLVAVFHEVKRVLKNDGTLWVNIGDTYATGGGRVERHQSKNAGVGANNIYAQNSVPLVGTPKGCKGKDLIGIPWLLAFALRSDGWYLRQDIIWHKPNPMPESVTDRCTKSHEYIFLLSKQPHYYFDCEAIKEEAICKDDRRNGLGHIDYKGKRSENDTSLVQKSFVSITDKRNKRDVWSVTVKAVKEAHFATFPEDLIKPCILAGCKRDGVVLDPFFGSGTTGRVAESLNRRYLGIELNPNYVEISKRRTDNVQLVLTGFMDM